MSSRRIDYSRLRSLTTRQIIRALSRDGFQYLRSSGRHQHYIHADGRFVTVAYHRPSGADQINILRSMIEAQARRSWDDLRRLGLV